MDIYKLFTYLCPYRKIIITSKLMDDGFLAAKNNSKFVLPNTMPIMEKCKYFGKSKII